MQYRPLGVLTFFIPGNNTLLEKKTQNSKNIYFSN